MTLAFICVAAAAVTMAFAEVRVTKVHFDPHVSRSGHGDNWHMTWASDDSQYTVLGDGMGWGGPEYNTRIWRLRGDATSFAPEDLPGYPEIGRAHRWYGYGIVSIKGALYHFISHTPQMLAPFNGSRLVFSEDLGQSWKMSDGTPMSWAPATPGNMFFWDVPGNAFSQISILQYGRDYQDNADGYLYLFAPNGYSDERMRELVLARVPIDRIRDRAAYQFYVRTNEQGAAEWSTSMEDRQPVHVFPEGWVAQDLRYSWHPSVVYNKALNLYMMAAGGTGRGGVFAKLPTYLGIYTAPNPWGPWTQVHEDEAWVSPGDPESRLYEPVIAPKWIDEDGLSFYLVFSDVKNWGDPWGDEVNYQFCTQKVTLAVEAEPAEPRPRKRRPCRSCR